MTESVSRERTRNYLRQIKGAVIYRAVALAASFIAIPVMIRYLGQERFGVWSTLLTVISWVVFFDLGIGNGLRNKVAECLAKGEKSEAGRYVSSGYTLIAVIALVLWLLVTVISYFVPWQSVFNAQAISEGALGETVRITVFFIVLNFWVGLIAALLGAVQKTSLLALGQLISNALVLVLVLLLSKSTEASITHLALAYGVSFVSSNIILSFWFYRSYPELRPCVKLEKMHVAPLLTIGFRFFAIQLAVLVIFTTDKILITQLFGPQAVTQYEVVFKLFSLVNFAHGIISAPLWSAYTDAYHRQDLLWVRGMLKKQLMIFFGIVAGVGLLALVAKPLIAVWVGGDVAVSSQLIMAMCFFVLVSVWNNIYAIFVNGVGKIRMQFYTAIAAMLLNIPLSVFFAKYVGLGVSGIVVGTICSLLFAAVALPLQVRRIIRPAIRATTA